MREISVMQYILWKSFPAGIACPNCYTLRGHQASCELQEVRV